MEPLKNKDCASVKKIDTFNAFIYVVVMEERLKALWHKGKRRM